MNVWIGLGRLTKTPELRKTKTDKSMCNFTIAVDRKYKSADGERQADFLNCTCFGQQAEFLTSYFQKGSRVAITGTVQSRTYDDADGKKIYVTEIMCDNFDFVDMKKDTTYEPQRPSVPSSGAKKINEYLPPEVDDAIYPEIFDL